MRKIKGPRKTRRYSDEYNTTRCLASIIDKSSSKGVENCQLPRPSTLNSAEHILDLINKFDLVRHSISRLREYDQGHIVWKYVRVSICI